MNTASLAGDSVSGASEVQRCGGEGSTGGVQPLPHTAKGGEDVPPAARRRREDRAHGATLDAAVGDGLQAMGAAATGPAAPGTVVVHARQLRAGGVTLGGLGSLSDLAAQYGLGSALASGDGSSADGDTSTHSYTSGQNGSGGTGNSANNGARGTAQATGTSKPPNVAPPQLPPPAPITLSPPAQLPAPPHSAPPLAGQQQPLPQAPAAGDGAPASTAAQEPQPRVWRRGPTPPPATQPKQPQASSQPPLQSPILLRVAPSSASTSSSSSSSSSTSQAHAALALELHPWLYDSDYFPTPEDENLSYNALFDPLYRAGLGPLPCGAGGGRRVAGLPGLCLAPHAPLLAQVVQPLYEDDYTQVGRAAACGHEQ